MSEPFFLSLFKIFLLFAGTTIVLQFVISSLGRRLFAQVRACWNRDFIEITRINPDDFRREYGTDAERYLFVVTNVRA